MMELRFTGGLLEASMIEISTFLGHILAVAFIVVTDSSFRRHFALTALLQEPLRQTERQTKNSRSFPHLVCWLPV